jgi:hypothetical protein
VKDDSISKKLIELKSKEDFVTYYKELKRALKPRKPIPDIGSLDIAIDLKSKKIRKSKQTKKCSSDIML